MTSPIKPLSDVAKQEIDNLLMDLESLGPFKTRQEVLDHVLMERLSESRCNACIINHYISLGADVHVKDPDGTNTLMIAIQNGDHDIVEVLIEHGMTGRHLEIEHYEDIVKHDRLDLLKLLVSSCDKTELFAWFKEAMEPMSLAVQNKRYSIIKYFIQEGMDVDAIVDDDGYNALHHSAESGDETLVDMLLELGASVYRCTSGFEDQLPFQLAINKGHQDLAVNKLLPLNINAPDPKPVKWREPFVQGPEIDDSGFTMLMYACFADRESTAKMLVECGADPNVAVRGILPLQVAIVNQQQKTIDYLYPLTDLSLIKWEKTLLDEALFFCMNSLQHCDENDSSVNITVAGKPLLTYLLEAGAGVNQTDIAKLDYEAPLMSAFESQSPKHIRILLDEGADPNIQCKSYSINGLSNILFSLVHDARNDYDFLKLFLQANPDIQRLSRLKVKFTDPSYSSLYGNLAVGLCHGSTPMQEALGSKEGELITLCVEAGCCLYDTKVILDAVKDSIEPPLQPHIIELIEKYDSSPRSLEHLAKFAVRRCLGHKDVNSRIDVLPLPKHLKGYVRFIGF